MSELIDRGAKRAAAKETWRAQPRGDRLSFNDFWRERNDPERNARHVDQQKRSMKRRHADAV
jgi:hypothetical protein